MARCQFENDAVTINDHSDQNAMSDRRQTTNQAARFILPQTDNCSNTSTTNSNHEGAESKVKRRNESCGYISKRTGHSISSEPTPTLKSDQHSKTHSPASIPTIPLDPIRWTLTPYQVLHCQHVPRWPRLIACPDSVLCRILGVGEYPIATAIARIHLYRHENSVAPGGTSLILKLFGDIYRGFRDNPHISLLDPLIYDGRIHSRSDLEAFRRKEWGWLVRAGGPIAFPDKLPGNWNLITVQANYRTLKIDLVLSRGNERMTYAPDPDEPPQDPGALRVRFYHHLCS